MRYYIISIVCMIVITSCNNNRRPNPSMDSSPMMTGFPASSNNTEIESWENDPENTGNMPDYYGTYEGLLPAADAEGIRTTLKLYDDNTYVLTSVYEGKEDNGFEEHGRFYVNGDMLTLQANNEEAYYRISDGYITKLDNDKQEITGNLADNYKLSKQ